MAEICRQPNKTDTKTVVFLTYIPHPKMFVIIWVQRNFKFAANVYRDF